jgi:hypothetical protein
MTKRKTIAVKDVIGIVNEMLKNSEADAKDVRLGASRVLEQVLMKTGHYSGFRYLLPEEVKSGPPGINYVNGLPDTNYNKRFDNTDETRVHYF